MIPIKRLDLNETTRAVLQKRQDAVASIPPGDSRIEDRWNYLLKHDTAAVTDIRARFDEMFGDSCCYCEIERAQDIEHYCPKSLYPAKMFTWDNFLRACKNCNWEKSNLDPLSANGQRWLLDPTKDNPDDYFLWSLETGEPVYKNFEPGAPHRGRDTLAACGVIHPTHSEMRLERAMVFMFILLYQTHERPFGNEVRSLLHKLINGVPHRRGVIRQVLLDPRFEAHVGVLLEEMPKLRPAIEKLRYRHPAVESPSP